MGDVKRLSKGRADRAARFEKELSGSRLFKMIFEAVFDLEIRVRKLEGRRTTVERDPKTKLHPFCTDAK